MTIYTEALRGKGPYKHEEPTSFVNNYQQALGSTIESGMSISRLLSDVGRGYKKQRDEQLDSLLADGSIPEDYGKMLGDYMSYGDLAIIARDRLGLPVRSDDEVNEAIRGDIRRNAAEANRVMGQASFTGKVGAVVGTLHAAMLDPPAIVGSVFGLGAAAKGATVLSRLAIAVGVGAGSAMAEEVVIQPFVYRWKQDVGLDYSVDDALKNIKYAAIGGGILGGSFKTAGEFVVGTRKFLNSRNVSQVKDASPAAKEAFSRLTDRVVEAESLPHETNIRQHFEEVDAYIKSTDTAAPSTKVEVDLEDATDEVVDATFKATFVEASRLPDQSVSPDMGTFKDSPGRKRVIRDEKLSIDPSRVPDQSVSPDMGTFKGPTTKTQVVTEVVEPKNAEVVSPEASQLPDSSVNPDMDSFTVFATRQVKPWPTGKPDPSVVKQPDPWAKDARVPEIENAVYVKDIVDEGGGRKSVIEGDAVAEVDRITTEMKSMDAFKNCMGL